MGSRAGGVQGGVGCEVRQAGSPVMDSARRPALVPLAVGSVCVLTMPSELHVDRMNQGGDAVQSPCFALCGSV